MHTILTELSKDAGLSVRIAQLANGLIVQIDEDKMAQTLFNSLNALDVITLWESSGKGYYGYNDPTDVAFDMLDDVVEEHRREMRKFRTLGMAHEEEVCFRAILKGLSRYAEEGNNEFRDWAPDDPYTLIDNEIYDWCKTYPSTDETLLRESLGL
jgi:hypothetical protein